MTVYDLPGDKHTYGKKVTDDPEPIKYGILWMIQSLMDGVKGRHRISRLLS